MDKYYKAEDVINKVVEYISIDYPTEERAREDAELLFADLPTIEVSEDCISRDWVLNRLTKYQKDYALNELGDWQNTVVEWITTDIENAPSVIPKAKEGEWIPCSERMPEEREWIGTKKFGTTISDKVLVTFESRDERFVKQIHFQNGELGGMDKHTMDAVHGEWKAVAWMPLPEPWKGADDEYDK